MKTPQPDKTPTFDVWLKQCDKVVMGKLCLSLHDLADADWRGYYKDELSPADACDCAFQGLELALIDDMWSDDMPYELWRS